MEGIGSRFGRLSSTYGAGPASSAPVFNGPFENGKGSGYFVSRTMSPAAKITTTSSRTPLPSSSAAGHHYLPPRLVTPSSPPNASSTTLHIGYEISIPFTS